MSSQLIFFSLSFASHPNSNRDTSDNFIPHLSIEHFIFPHQHFQKAGHVLRWSRLKRDREGAFIFLRRYCA